MASTLDLRQKHRFVNHDAFLAESRTVLRNAAFLFILLVPSLWVLTRPFGWTFALRAMAVGTWVPLVVFGVIGCFRKLVKNSWTSAFEWAAITFCFAFLQAYIFNTALHPENRFNILGGLLQNSDPSMYLSLAGQWADGGQVYTPQTTRQFFPCFLSAMLWLCHENLKVIVSLFALATGSVAFLAWREVRRGFGWVGATLFVTLVFFFYRCEVVGLLRTEQLGLWFALIAIALLLYGLREKREVWWNVGLFSLVMGFNTRAGTYLILPLLILYSGWVFRKGRYGWKSVVFAAVTCLLGMALNAACYLIFFAAPRPTSNFWLCFYGMLTGGSWGTALNKIGLIFDRTNLIARERGLALLREKPWLLWEGFCRACRFVWETNTFYGIPPTSGRFCLWLKWLTLPGASIPLIWALVKKRIPTLEWFVFAIVLGSVLSLPFAPPWDGGRRVYAVSFPFVYLAPALLIATFLKEIRSHIAYGAGSSIFAKDPTDVWIGKCSAHFACGGLLVLVVFCTLVPLRLMLMHHPKNVWYQPQFAVPLPGGCPANKLPAGYQIHLVPDTARTFVPWVRVSDFRKSLERNLEMLRAPWVLDLLRELPAGTTIATACHSCFFVIATDKAMSSRLSQRHPILNRSWHRVVYDNEFPMSSDTIRLLAQAKAPPVHKGK